MGRGRDMDGVQIKKNGTRQLSWNEEVSFVLVFALLYSFLFFLCNQQLSQSIAINVILLLHTHYSTYRIAIFSSLF